MPRCNTSREDLGVHLVEALQLIIESVPVARYARDLESAGADAQLVARVYAEISGTLKRVSECLVDVQRCFERALGSRLELDPYLAELGQRVDRLGLDPDCLRIGMGLNPAVPV